MNAETRGLILAARDSRAREYAEASRRVEAEVLDSEMGGEIRRQYLHNGISAKTISDLLDVGPEIILRILRISIPLGVLHRRRDVYWSHREHSYVVPRGRDEDGLLYRRVEGEAA